MTTAPTRRPRRVRRTVIVAVALACLIVGAVAWSAPERYFPWDTASFPDSTTGAESALAARVVEVARAEHADPKPGTHYAEGVDEAWCADFVSWVMRESGAPLTNPHSGSWRIPGVYTLTEYYQEQGRFEAVGDHRPSVGDVVLYDNAGPLGRFTMGQHTNLVIAVDGDTVTTVGGNEMGGIRVHTLDVTADTAVVGFGRLPVE